MPAGVPPDPELPPPPLPPPHEARNITNKRDIIAALPRAKPRERRPTGSHTIPISAVAQNHAKDELLRSNAAPLRAMVVTLTVNVDAVVALTFSLLGREQVAPVGAPEQVNAAVPLNPLPPIESVYMAVDPAVTVAEFEPPGGMVRPGEVTPVPVRGTLCMPIESVMVSVPASAPTIVGVKVTEMAQPTPASSTVPQVLVSAKSLALGPVIAT